jgi:ectoine hydroxylase-related dioxygenase (phytanoyl-CoA dioxygenase family)
MAYNRSLSEFSSEGYVVLDGLIPPERADVLFDAFDELPLGGSPSSVPGAAPGRRQANERALVRDPRFVEVLTEPALLEAVEGALGDDVHLLAYEAIEIPAGGGKARDWHSDFHFPTEAALVVNIGIYLQEMEDERGPLYVVPGSHRWNREPSSSEVEAELPDEVKLPLVRGSAVLFHGRLWHTGSRNASVAPRRAIFPYFGHKWIKRMDDFYRAPLPEAIQTSEDPVLRRLFGLEPGTPVHGATYRSDNRDWL